MIGGDDRRKIGILGMLGSGDVKPQFAKVIMAFSALF